MKITRSLKAGAALAAVVGSLGAGAALAPAEAVAGCATGYTCLWDDTDYKTNDTTNSNKFQYYQAHMGRRRWREQVISRFTGRCRCRFSAHFRLFGPVGRSFGLRPAQPMGRCLASASAYQVELGSQYRSWAPPAAPVSD